MIFLRVLLLEQTPKCRTSSVLISGIKLDGAGGYYDE